MIGSTINRAGTKNEQILTAIRPLALTLAALYCFLAVQDLLAASDPARLTSCYASAATAFVFAVYAGVLGRVRLRPDIAHPLVFSLAVILFGSMGIEGALAQSELGQAGVPLGVLGTGLVMYARRWIVASAVVGATYGLISVNGRGGLDVQFIGSLAIATLLALIAAHIRSRAFKQWRRLSEEARRRRAALEESEQRYSLAVEGSSDGLYDWNHGAGEVYYSPRWKAMLGYEENEIGTSPDELWDRIHPDDAPRVKDALVAHFKGTMGHFESELRVRHKDGEFRWALIRGASRRNAEGRAIRTAGSMTDMTGRGVFDALTGLPNRRLLADRVKRAIEHSQRGHQDFALLFIDLDRFKLINDTLGHQAGDEMLVEVAARLQTCVRASDTVARLGGDEFVVILERIELPDGAHISINRILTKLGQSFRIGDQDFYISASIGVVLDTQPYSTPEELIRDADTAMYQAKSRQQGWAVFDSTMRERFAARLHMETELRRALENREFRLEYQPIISLHSDETEGYEALVRWDHPERGTVHPGEFIETLEETGLINQLGTWVLEQACREMQERFPDSDERGRPTLSVNVSRKQLTEADLPNQVKGALARTGFQAHRLRLEITETAIIEQAEMALSTLHAIKALGIEIMMDDFGTGHSSLGALGSLPIDTLKIDRSFVARLAQDSDGLEVVRTIIAMGTHLGLKIVAEGIETEEQLNLLRDSACPSGQGFFFSRPTDLASADQRDQPSPVDSAERPETPEGVTS